MPNSSKRIYRPGSRNPKFRYDGKFSKSRFAWLRTIVGQFVIMRYDAESLNQETGDDDEDGPTSDTEFGPTIRLVLPQGNRASVRYNITALTLDELQKTREFFNLLFDMAEPVVRERDRIAHEAFESGDDSHARIYRQVPQFIVRKRNVGADGEGVQHRYEDAAARPARDGGSDHGAGVVGSELADGNPQAGRAQDDDSTDH